jgi:hypothetical protein
VSLSSDFLVWAASPEADFLRGKIVYASWDVEELKERKTQIMGVEEKPGSGELFLGFQGFPRYMGGTLLGPAPASSTDAPAEDDRSVKRNRQD